MTLLYVFYNGKNDCPEEEILKLSDSFKSNCDIIALEVKVRVINVNYQKGAQLLSKCKTLNEYSKFIFTVRQHLSEGLDFEEAIAFAIEECSQEGVLKDFLEMVVGLLPNSAAMVDNGLEASNPFSITTRLS